MLIKPIKKLRSLWQLSPTEKMWLIFLYPYSALIRASILLLPFYWLAQHMGKHYYNFQLSPLVTDQQLQLAWRIGRLVEQMARYTPWDSKCLVQAIMVRTLLGWYKIPYILHFGVQLTRQQQKAMKAHAWIKVGKWVIVGQKGHKNYGIVGSYIAPSILPDRIPKNL